MTNQEKLSKINNELTIAIAEEKARKAAAEADYYARVHILQKGAQEMREAVNNEPDEPQDGDQPAVWLNGEQWTCVVAARRILNKLPLLHYPEEAYQIVISKSYFGSFYLDLNYVNTVEDSRGVVNAEIFSEQKAEEQAAKVDEWITMVKGKMIEVKNAKDAKNE